MSSISMSLNRAVRSSSACLSASRAFSSASRARQQLKRTPLYNMHVSPELGGKMVPFSGWEMPLMYQGRDKRFVAGGALNEHHAVRNSAGLFDVGHMAQFVFQGNGATMFLESMLPSALQELEYGDQEDYALNRGTLSLILNEDGGIIDDCVVTRWGHNTYYVVSNAANAAVVLEHFDEAVADWNVDPNNVWHKVSCEPLDGWGLIALQGPRAADVLKHVMGPEARVRFKLESMYFSQSGFFPLLGNDVESYHVSRTGYTGEDGFEISIPGDMTDIVAQRLLDAGVQLDAKDGSSGLVKMCGLAARDSLRIEAGLCLMGTDMTNATHASEAALGWVIAKERRDSPNLFKGAARTLAGLKKGGSERKRIGLALEKGPPARNGAKIYSADGGEQPIGEVTSGIPSPTLGSNIAMGYISTAAPGLHKRGSDVLVDVRGKRLKAKVVPMPFVPARYHRQVPT